MYFEFTKDSRTLDADVEEFFFQEGGMILPDADSPMPYDAGFEVKNGDLIIVGGVGPSGYGKVRIEVPVANAPYYLAVTVPNVKDRDWLRASLVRLGYRKVDQPFAE